MPYGRSKDGTKNDKGEKFPDLSGDHSIIYTHSSKMPYKML